MAKICGRCGESISFAGRLRAKKKLGQLYHKSCLSALFSGSMETLPDAFAAHFQWKREKRPSPWRRAFPAENRGLSRFSMQAYSAEATMYCSLSYRALRAFGTEVTQARGVVEQLARRLSDFVSKGRLPLSHVIETGSSALMIEAEDNESLKSHHVAAAIWLAVRDGEWPDDPPAWIYRMHATSDFFTFFLPIALSAWAAPSDRSILLSEIGRSGPWMRETLVGAARGLTVAKTSGMLGQAEVEQYCERRYANILWFLRYLPAFESKIAQIE